MMYAVQPIACMVFNPCISACDDAHGNEKGFD